MASIRVTYSDAHGRDETAMTNDGETLSIDLRGVTFTGSSFEDLSPSGRPPKELLACFVLHHDRLRQCSFFVSMPTVLVEANAELALDLEASIELGPPPSEHFSVRLSLAHPQATIISSGTSSSFEYELIEIQRRLPEGSFLRNCFGCAYSDYSPYGNCDFGDMLCFRNLKKKYLAVRTKEDLLKLHSRHDRLVQETYVCEEFVRRTAGSGYRG